MMSFSLVGSQYYGPFGHALPQKANLQSRVKYLVQKSYAEQVMMIFLTLSA